MRHMPTYPASDRIVCRYTDKHTIILYYIAALAGGAAFIHFIYVNDDVREFLARPSQVRDERKILLYGFSAIWLAVLADFLLQARAFLRGRPALVINSVGVSGLHGGLWREIDWNDLARVEVTDRHIRLVRGPRSFLPLSGVWSNFRLCEYCIHVLLTRTDGSKFEILRAVRHYRPDLL